MFQRLSTTDSSYLKCSDSGNWAASRVESIFIRKLSQRSLQLWHQHERWTRNKWTHWSRTLSGLGVYSADFKSRRSALRDDLRPLSTLHHSLSHFASLSVTPTPVGPTLLNKASSEITPSCLSAQLRYKSFIKHRRERRSISNHQHWGGVSV